MARGWFTNVPIRPPRARRPRLERPAPRCVDCGGMLVRTPGPGRAPLRCASCRTRAKAAPKWRLAPGALETVQRHFGLQHPIHLRRSAGRAQHGSYRGTRYGSEISRRLDPDRLYHVIHVSSALDPETAARALLHEACHAGQREADPDVHRRANREINRHGRRSHEGAIAYYNHPPEREARLAEGAVRLLGPLMLPG